MANSAQTLNPNQKFQEQKPSNPEKATNQKQENDNKINNNNETTASCTGGMKDEGGSCSSDSTKAGCN